MAKGTYIGINSLARKVKGMYIGVNGFARKVKKGYIGVNGVARLFYSDGEDKFSSNIFPTNWILSSDKLSATTSDKYGTWSLTASGNRDAANPLTLVFDNSTSTYWSSQSLGTAESGTITITLPEGIAINPKTFNWSLSIYGSYRYIYGTRVDTGERVTLYSVEAGSTGNTLTTETVTPDTDLYFSSFTIASRRYSSSTTYTQMNEFQCISGTIKKVNEFAFTKNIIPLLTSNNYTDSLGRVWIASATHTNEYAYKAFDGNTGTEYYPVGGLDDSEYAEVQLDLPNGISISPSKFSMTHMSHGVGTIQGYSSESNSWVTLAEVSSRSASSATNSYDSLSADYFTKFKISLSRYSASTDEPYIMSFEITNGKIKIK